VAGAAAAVNCLIEQRIDAIMARTRGARCRAAKSNSLETLLLSGVIGGIGLSAAARLRQSASRCG
jgi:protoheme IX farnesyltransferase